MEVFKYVKAAFRRGEKSVLASAEKEAVGFVQKDSFILAKYVPVWTMRH